MQSSQNYKYRPLKIGEISFALDAYERMLIEIQHYEESEILPTRRTIDTVANIITENYRRGNECYVVTENELIVGYSLVMENYGFDLKRRIFNGIGLFIEPEYRKQGLGISLIEYTLDKLKEAGVAKFYANFILERPTSQDVIKRFDFKVASNVVCKTF